jgi:hypothetical protein
MTLILLFLTLSCSSQSYNRRGLAHSKESLKPTLAFDKVSLSSINVKDLSSRDKVVFIAFGDSGTGPNEDYQYMVAKQMVKACRIYKCDFGVMLGDNFYEGDYSYDGVQSIKDPKWAEMFEAPYKGFKSNLKNFHFWPVLGNHDYPDEEEDFLKAVNAQINYSLHSSLWRMPYSYYSIPELPSWLHIFSFDTELLTEDAGGQKESGDPLQVKVARDFFCDKNKNGWKLAMGHHPFITFGPRGSQTSPSNKNDMDALASFVHPILKGCSVDAYFSGHDHVQEHITTPFYDLIVQGSAAEANPLWEDINIPNKPPLYLSNLFNGPESYKKRYVKGRELGFAIVEVTREKMEVQFIKVPFDGTSFLSSYSFTKHKGK